MVRGDVGEELQRPLAYRITGPQWVAVDVATAVLAALAITFQVRFFRVPHLVLPDGPMLAASLAATVPVAIRRAWPLPVLAVVTAGVSVLTAYGLAPLGTDLMLGMVTYMAALKLARPVAIAALMGTEVAIGAGLLTAAATAHTQSVMLHSMLATAATWFVGYGVRERRRYRVGVEEQERQWRAEEAERGRRAVQEERLRIAREMHDVLAHTLSMVVVQAGVGRRVGTSQPAQALQALRVVEESSRGALDELRRILCLMRGDDATGPERPGVGADEGAARQDGQPALDGAVLVPAPGLGELEALVAMVRSAGTPVTLSVTGDVTGVPPATALTAYRITQEALTNVVRHAPGAQASVLVGVGADGIRISVTDTGQGDGALAAVGRPAASSAQHGIVGMRERASAFGGTLSAGATPGGGFEVAAFLPVPGRRRAA
jgi:signal transduction histidine kinase